MRRLKCPYLHTLALLAMLMLASVAAHAQYLRYVGAYKFLGASSVYHIMRDRAGFLWFCTNHGLARYDGHTMRYYTMQDGLPDNRVFNAYEDKRGRIWPFCYNGRYCFIYNGQVHSEANDTLLASLPHTDSYITYMVADADSGIYMGFLSQSILHLRGAVWRWDKQSISRHGGLLVAKNRISYIPAPMPGIIVPVRGNRKLISDRDGLKIFTNNILTWQLDDAALTDQTVTDLCHTENGQLIVCTTHGLEIVNLANGKRTTMLEGIRVTGCVADVAGNFWISTANNGIYQLHRELEGIRRLPLADGCEWSTVNDNKAVFITDNGLYELQADSTKVNAVLVKKDVPNYYDPILVTDHLLAFYDNWHKHSLFQLRSGKTIFKTTSYFKRMYAYNDSCFFACGKNETAYYRLSGSRFDARTPSVRYTEKITASCQDPVSKQVYFICADSLFRFNFEKGRTKLVYTNAQLRGATALLARDSGLVITTGGQQYFSIVPHHPAGSLRVHNTKFIVYGFIPFAGAGLIIMSEGENYLVKDHETTNVQTISYPFSSSTYEHLVLCGNYCMMRIDDKCYYFDTALFNRQATQPDIYLQRVVVNGKVYTTNSIALKNTRKADLQVSIGMLDFGNNGHDISYRITGPEGPGVWNRSEAPQIAIVLHEAGKYSIEIRPASGAAGKQPLVIQLVLHTPFFRSGTFYTMSTILALLLCGGIVIWTMRYRRLHFIRELNYLKMEQRAMNALLNPHFVFNSINNIQALIHKAKREDAADYLTTLSRLIRQNLENLKCNLIPLEDELTLIERYVSLQNLRFSGNIKLHTSFSEPGLLQVQVLPLLVHTFVENAIVHGYRHKEQLFTINISVERHHNNYLKIVVRDDGVGVHATSESPATHFGSSMGISFSSKRLNRLSDHYNLQQSVAVADLSETGSHGTEVVIIIYARLKQLFERKQLPVY